MDVIFRQSPTTLISQAWLPL